MAKTFEGLSERLRQMPSATQLEALQERVKELESNPTPQDYLKMSRMWAEEKDRATRAEQELYTLQSELDTANDNHRAMAAQLARIGQERDEALERAAKVAEQHQRELASVEKSLPDFDAKRAANMCAETAGDIAAAIRRLAAGPDKNER